MRIQYPLLARALFLGLYCICIVSAIIEGKLATLSNVPGRANDSTAETAVNFGDPNSVQQLLSTLSSNPGDLATHMDKKTRKDIVKVSELGQPRQLLPLAYLRGLSRFLAAGALTRMKGTFISLKLPYCKCQLLWLPTTRTTMELRT